MPGTMSEEEAYKLVMKQEDRKKNSRRRKRRALGLKTELIADLDTVTPDDCGVTDVEWAVLKVILAATNYHQLYSY